MLIKKDKDLERLYDKRRILRNKSDEKGKQELEELDEELGAKYSDIMSDKIIKEVEGMDDPEDGGFNVGKLWRLKKKLFPKVSQPPTAMSIWIVMAI